MCFFSATYVSVILHYVKMMKSILLNFGECVDNLSWCPQVLLTLLNPLQILFVDKHQFPKTTMNDISFSRVVMNTWPSQCKDVLPV